MPLEAPLLPAQRLARLRWEDLRELKLVVKFPVKALNLKLTSLQECLKDLAVTPHRTPQSLRFYYM